MIFDDETKTTFVAVTVYLPVLNVTVAPDWKFVPARFEIGVLFPLTSVFGVIEITVGAGFVTVI